MWQPQGFWTLLSVPLLIKTVLLENHSFSMTNNGLLNSHEDYKPNVTKKSSLSISIKINQGHLGHNGLRLMKKIAYLCSYRSPRTDRNKIHMVAVIHPLLGREIEQPERGTTPHWLGVCFCF